jgi:hypothetical protein
MLIPTGDNSLQIQVPIETLFRQTYNGDNSPDKDLVNQFLKDVFTIAIKRCSEIFDINDLSFTTFKVITGKKAAVYDENLGQVPEGPYYLWCRIESSIPNFAIKNWGAYGEMTRKRNGMLEAIYI